MTIIWSVLEINVRALKSTEVETNPNSACHTLLTGIPTLVKNRKKAFSTRHKMHLLAQELAQFSFHIFWLKLILTACIFYEFFRKKTSVHLVSSLMLGSMDQSRKTWDNWSLTESPRKERKARLDVFAEKTIGVSEKNFLMLMSSNTTCQLRCLHEDHITCYWFHDSLFPVLEVWPDTVLIRKNQFLFLQWVFLTT